MRLFRETPDWIDGPPQVASAVGDVIEFCQGRGWTPDESVKWLTLAAGMIVGGHAEERESMERVREFARTNLYGSAELVFKKSAQKK